MPDTLLSLRRRPLKMARHLKSSVANAQKRVFNPDPLVQAEKTPYEVIFSHDIVKLRYYPPLVESQISVGGKMMPVAKKTHKTPLVLVSPLAVNMYIYDLFTDRSLVKYLRAQGFELYLVDWGRPGWQHNHYSIASYFKDWMPELLAKVREHSGQQKLSLHGWSLGGLFSLCYTALGDPDIENLILVGAPCDYHNNGALGKQYRLLSKQLRWLEKKTGWRVHQTKRRWWRSPGWANALAFKLTNPVASVQGYLDLVRNLHSEEYVINHATNGAFLDNMVAYPGAVIQDVVQFLLTDNVVAHGKLPMIAPEPAVDDAMGHLNQVNANLLLVCGTNDPIVTRECSVAMLKHVNSSDHKVLDVPGGHMGILSGSNAPRDIWPEIVAWLQERSSR
ncbi:MAG: alpha/beta fold hydrolase [Pseudomonadales bacterium]|uniref:Hydrolase, alpha/beta fold family protein n=1 Tax=Oleiphilus messinensis TaxID=141451 RepID=A0A1Y0I792_9GAMM|nr:alpha/beta fold hydrolase [Oleiphilus messinensis]ARU55646.1 hydrolase, alpha/beta fold family protein [Oleiphilus messinensis]MCG8611322.1 alpha/beta fold hydrolase [Pseudomonadales bacterium]